MAQGKHFAQIAAMHQKVVVPYWSERLNRRVQVTLKASFVVNT